WNAAWQDAGYFELARILSRQGRCEQALEKLAHCLNRNGLHHKARHLKTALLRHLGQTEAARSEVQQALEHDSMEYGALWERYLIDGETTFQQIVRTGPAV